MSDVTGNTVPLSEQSREELLARIQQLEAQGTNQAKTGIYFKVSEKGAVSVYGIGRFPVTLYRQQWQRLMTACTGLSEDDLGQSPMSQFITEHDSELPKLENKVATKLQNTVEAIAQGALEKAYRTYRAAGYNVAEAEKMAYSSLNIAKPKGAATLEK